MTEKFFKLIDIFPQTLVLTYKGKMNFKTVFGGFLTILSVIFIFSNAILIGNDIYLRENPITLESQIVEPYRPTTRFNYKRNLFAFQLTNLNEEIFWDETVLQFIPTLIIGENIEGEFRYREIFMEMTDCIEEYKNLNITIPLKENIMTGLKCIKDLDVYLSGSFLEEHISYLSMKVKTCENSTYYPYNNLDSDELIKSNNKLIKEIKDLNPFRYGSIKYQNKEEKLDLYDKLKKYLDKPKEFKKNCKSKNEIEKIVNGLYLNFFYDNIKTNSKSYEKPLVKSPSTDFFHLGSSMKKNAKYFFTNYLIETDAGIIFEEKFYQTNEVGLYKKIMDFNLILIYNY